MITDIKIKSLKFKDKNYSFKIGDGLNLLLKSEEKSKLWEFRYTSPTIKDKSGKFKRRKTSFGTYPHTKLASATKKRDLYIELIRQNIDPLEQKKIDKQNIKIKSDSNFKKIADEWLEFEAKGTTPATHKRKKAIIVNDAYPYLAKKSINEITYAEVIVVLKKRLNKKINKKNREPNSNDGVETTHKLYRYLDTIWKFAITQGLCEINLFDNMIKKFVVPKAETTHHPKITDKLDLTKLVNDMYNYNGNFTTVCV